MKTCLNCSSTAPDEVMYCKNCGAALPDASQLDDTLDMRPAIPVQPSQPEPEVEVIGKKKKEKPEKGPKSPGKIIVSLFLVVVILVLGAGGVFVFKNVGETKTFSTGEIADGVYINKWAGFKLDLSNGWTVNNESESMLDEIIKGFGLSIFSSFMDYGEYDYGVNDAYFSAKSPSGVSVFIKYDEKENFNENFGLSYQAEITSDEALMKITGNPETAIEKKVIGRETFSSCNVSVLLTSLSISTLVKDDHVVIITLIGSSDKCSAVLGQFEKPGFLPF